MTTVNAWNEIDEHGDNLARFVVDENCTCVDFIGKTEQPIDRLRRICKIEGVAIHDDSAVIKLCREYLDGDALLSAYNEWRKAGWTQAAIDSGLIDKPCDAPTNCAMSAYAKLNRFSKEDKDMIRHTEGNWVVREHENSFTIGQEHKGGKLIAETAPFFSYLGTAAKEVARANARRISACVNALEGLTTEQIEDGVFQRMREHRDFLVSEVDALTKQRDELLAALQEMIDIASDSQGVAGYHLNVAVADWDEFEERQTACDAIAKAKGAAE